VTKPQQIAPSLPSGIERPANTSSINSLVGWHGSAPTRPARRRHRSASPSPSFASFEASFIGEQAVLTVWGQIDPLTKPEFDAILDAVIDCGRGSVELDLRQLNFMHVSGLNAIAQGTQRLEDLHRTFTIRPPSAMVLRTIESTALAGLVRVEASGPAPVRRGASPPRADLRGQPAGTSATPAQVEPMIDRAAATSR
jgi:anti-anti-sigma factor